MARTYSLDNIEIQEFWQGIASKYRAHKSYFGIDDFGEDLIPEVFFDAIEAGEDITQKTWTYTVHGIEYERDSLELAVALMTVEATNKIPTQSGGGISDSRSDEDADYFTTNYCFPDEDDIIWGGYIFASNPAYVTTSSYIEVAGNPYSEFLSGWNVWGSIPSAYDLETLKAELKVYRYLGISHYSRATYRLDSCGGDIFRKRYECHEAWNCVHPTCGDGQWWTPVWGIEYGYCSTRNWTSHTYIYRWFIKKDTIPTGEKYPIQGYDFEDAYDLYKLLNP